MKQICCCCCCCSLISFSEDWGLLLTEKIFFSWSFCNMASARDELELLSVQTVTSLEPLKLNKTSLEVVRRLSLASATPLLSLLHFLCLCEGQTLTLWLSFWLALDLTVLHFKQIEYWTRDKPTEAPILAIKQLNEQILTSQTSENEYTQFSKGIVGC